VTVGDQTIARVGPGDFVGEIAVLDRGFRTASVVAETDMVVEICGTSEFAVLLAGAPTLTRKLLIGLAQRLRTTDERLTA
jgi:CRP/FNR family transcriptional regulator, cyclic AMP receptor protein